MLLAVLTYFIQVSSGADREEILRKSTAFSSFNFFWMRWCEAIAPCWLKMVNGLHLYSAFIQSTVQFMPLIHPSTHIFTHQRQLAAMQGTNQEQFRVRRLAQGHFDMLRVGSNRQPSDCQMTALTFWAASPILSYKSFMKRYTKPKL